MSVVRKVLHGILVVWSMVFAIASPGEGQATSPLTLHDAIAAAQRHHPYMEEAIAGIAQARGAVKGARAELYPTISVAEDALYSTDPVFAFGSKLRQARFTSDDFALDALNHPSALSNFSASATGTWTAFDAGSTRHKVKAADGSFQAAELAARYTGEQLAAQMATLYYRVLTAEDQATAAERAVKRAREVDESVQDRVRSGLSLESDGRRAHFGLRSAEDDFASVKSNIALARHDLFAAMGEPPSNQSLVRTDTLQNFSDADQETAGDPKQRFDILALDSQQQAARQSLAAIRAEAWPRVTTFGHVENDAEWVLARGSGNWTVGAKIQWSVFDGGARRSREQEADARMCGVEAKRRLVLLEADSTIAALRNQIDDLRRRLATAEYAIHVQQEALQTSRDRYNTGLVAITDVLLGESELSNAEFLKVRMYYQLRIADANLALATGKVTTPRVDQP